MTSTATLDYPDTKLVEWPIVDSYDEDAILIALRDGLTGYDNPALVKLEKEWAEYCGVPYCLGLTGGTAAIHAALFAAGVGMGDEVIVPAFSFAGTFLPIMALGATPIFVDIDLKTFNIDVEKIEEAITEKTKVIMPVHIHGLMADMGGIIEIASKYDLLVIEDACQAHGAKYLDRMAGTIGAAGCFSLNHTKSLPAGEGGLMITSNQSISRRANMFRIFGEDLPFDLETVGRVYHTKSLGLNYLLPAMTAALASSQLMHLDGSNERARHNANVLSAILSKSRKVLPPEVPQHYEHTFHKYRLKINPSVKRDPFIERLREKGVQCGLWQITPMPLYPLFSGQYTASDFPVATYILKNSIIVGTEKYPLCAQDEETVVKWGELILEELES